MEKKLLVAETKTRTLEQQAIVRKPPKVNRGQQTPTEWDYSSKYCCFSFYACVCIRRLFNFILFQNKFKK